MDADRSLCISTAENTGVANMEGVVVVRCDALSDTQKWVFDTDNDLIRYKADSRFCLRKVAHDPRLVLSCPRWALVQRLATRSICTSVMGAQAVVGCWKHSPQRSRRSAMQQILRTACRGPWVCCSCSLAAAAAATSSGMCRRQSRQDSSPWHFGRESARARPTAERFGE